MKTLTCDCGHVVRASTANAVISRLDVHAARAHPRLKITAALRRAARRRITTVKARRKVRRTRRRVRRTKRRVRRTRRRSVRRARRRVRRSTRRARRRRR